VLASDWTVRPARHPAQTGRMLGRQPASQPARSQTYSFITRDGSEDSIGLPSRERLPRAIVRRVGWTDDLRVDLRRDGCTWVTVLPRVILAPRTQALVLMRLTSSAPRWLAVVLRRLNYTLNGCDISPEAQIGPGLSLPHPFGVVIGPGVELGAGCTVAQHVTLGAGADGSPKLEDEVGVGAGAVLFGGIRVGRQARIGANSVLWQDVPAGMIAAGAPAKPLSRWSGATVSSQANGT
jgi:serine O-acetyltransferase